MSRRRAKLGSRIAAGLLWLVPIGLSGQSGELDRVDRFLQEGRFEEARAGLEEWLDSEWDGASRDERQQGLWLRAVLTIDPGMAELDYRRLAVEFPGGSFSDGALLRLAHAARLRGDEEIAAEYLAVLVRDYPASPHRVEARSLLSQMSGDASATSEGPLPAPSASTASRPTPDTRAGPRSDPTPAQPDDRGPFTIQLGAFSTEARATSFALDFMDAGLDAFLQPRVVILEGSELARVRVGAFTTREEADTAAEEVRARGFDAVVSSDRESEEPFR